MSALTKTAPSVIEQVIAKGDLAKLSPEERVAYYVRTCESLGLNPLTKPFEYITLNGKLTLYARKDATEQLRKIHCVSLAIVGREMVEDVYMVTARATMPDGRTDESIGAVAIGGLKGEARANAIMKAETKAKRRVTLSACGLGILDENEVESIPDARPVAVEAAHAPALPPPPPDILTREQFKARWESDDDGGGITYEDIANCAIAWGLTRSPKAMPLDKVRKMVLEAAGIKEEDDEPATEEQIEMIGKLLEGLAYHNVPDEKLLAGINALTKLNLMTLDDLTPLTQTMAANVIEVYSAKLDKFDAAKAQA